MKTIDAVSYFEERASEYDRSRTVRFPKYGEALEVMALMLPFEEKEAITVLDLACGTGELSRVIGQRFPRAHFICLDAAPSMLRIAQEKLRSCGLRATTLRRDFTQPGWAEELPCCDAVVASYALNHVAVADQKRVLADCLQVLQPGGIFLSFDGFLPEDPVVGEVYRRLRPAGNGMTGKKGEVKAAHYFTTMADRMALMREAGFVQVDCVWKYFKLAVLVGHRARLE